MTYTSWVHGSTAILVGASDEDLLDERHDSSGSAFRLDAGGSLEIAISIPMTVRSETRLYLVEVHLLFATSHGQIDSIDVANGQDNVASFWPQARGDHAGRIDGVNTWGFTPSVLVGHGICLFVGATYFKEPLADQWELRVAGAGAVFAEEPFEPGP